MIMLALIIFSYFACLCGAGCDSTICPYDSYCCNNSWDWICANSAVQECAAANKEDETPTDGSCCDCTESKNSPNCNEQCDNTICPYDSYCCNYSWDWICANSAVQECDASQNEEETDFYTPPGSGSAACCDCTEASDSANCNEECDSTICPYDSYCCNNKWDWICADSAKSECEAAGNIYEGEETNPEQGSDESCCECTETESTSGCTPNPSCDSIVCPIDSYCCNYSWDGICANGANNICNSAEYWTWPTEEETGSCCDCTEESDDSGCNEVCENEVCPLDSYCCNNKWDWICANGAENICQGYDYFNSDSYGYDDSYNYDYSTYEPYDYGYDSSNDYGYSSYEPDYGYSSDYSYYDSFNYGYSDYEPYYYDGYDSYDYGSTTYEPTYEPTSEPSYYGGYDSYQEQEDFEDVPAGKKLKTRIVNTGRQTQRNARSSKRSRSSKLRQQNKRPRSRLSKSQRQRKRQGRVRAQRSKTVRQRGRARRSLMAQTESRPRLSRRARSSRVQRLRPQRSRRVRSRKALSQREKQRQQRSQRVRRQRKRLRRY